MAATVIALGAASTAILRVDGLSRSWQAGDSGSRDVHGVTNIGYGHGDEDHRRWHPARFRSKRRSR